MALIVSTDRRIAHPTEPDTWFVLRLPLCAGDMENTQATSLAGVKIAMAVSALQEWSYPDPVTPENVRRLDLTTFNWLNEQISQATTIGEQEKKDSSSDSPPTTAPAEADSPESSGI